MSESGGVEFIQNENSQLIELYKNPGYITLYRYENPSITYDTKREGIVSKEGIVGSWFTATLADLKTYTKTRIRG